MLRNFEKLTAAVSLEKTIAVRPPCETRNPGCRRFGKNGFNDPRTRPDSRLGITLRRRLLLAPFLLDVRAALRSWGVNPAIRLGRIVRNELNGDG